MRTRGAQKARVQAGRMGARGLVGLSGRTSSVVSQEFGVATMALLAAAAVLKAASAFSRAVA